MIRTRLTERFGIQHPIVCAPMAYVTGGRLAAAVSRAGGLGVVGGAYAGTMAGEPDLDNELTQAKSGKFGVGFITWALERAPKMLTKALQYSPFCVFLSFGDPSPFAAEIAKAGAVLICQVQFLSQIDMAVEAGAAAIVVQGTEAGGHGASRSTFPFVPEAADYLKRHSPETLLIAAGGIADGRGLAAALMLGADGVVVGSRFWASAEALTPQAHESVVIDYLRADRTIFVNTECCIQINPGDNPDNSQQLLRSVPDSQLRSPLFSFADNYDGSGRHC